MSGSLPPGWYPAPGSPPVLRWWDGIRWTGETREADQAGPPEAGRHDAGLAPDGTPGGSPAPGAGPLPEAGAPPAVSAWRAPAVEAWQAQAAPARPERRRRWFSRPRHG